MKKIFATIIFVLSFCFSMSAQIQNSSCPLISVTGPSSVVQLGETMTFSSSISGDLKNNNLKYRWTIDKGTILEGQETKIITISTEGLLDTTVTATFEIEGLSKNCENQDSDTGVVAQILIGDPLDEYGKISLEDELARFDAFLSSMQQNPEYKGFVWITTDKNESILSVKKHIRRLVRHIKFRNILPNRVIFAIEKSEYHRTIIITVPEGAKTPECKNCEIFKGSDLK